MNSTDIIAQSEERSVNQGNGYLWSSGPFSIGCPELGPNLVPAERRRDGYVAFPYKDKVTTVHTGDTPVLVGGPRYETIRHGDSSPGVIHRNGVGRVLLLSSATPDDMARWKILF